MPFSEAEVLTNVKAYIAQRFSVEFTGHDVYHLQRVVHHALEIQKQEGGDVFIIEMAAWLHDVCDHKWFKGTPEEADEELLKLLSGWNVDVETSQRILQTINGISFSKNPTKSDHISLETKIVQDADRLDALGAIGIARAFSYGSVNQQLLYDPVKMDNREGKSSTVDHFHTKLLLLPWLMHTQYARNIALERVTFMQEFLERMKKEYLA